MRKEALIFPNPPRAQPGEFAVVGPVWRDEPNGRISDQHQEYARDDERFALPPRDSDVVGEVANQHRTQPESDVEDRKNPGHDRGPTRQFVDVREAPRKSSKKRMRWPGGVGTDVDSCRGRGGKW